MAVDVDARGGAFTAGVPRQLFRAPMKLSIGALRSGVPYDASPDGRAFAIVRFEEVTTPVAPTLHVYVHWAAALAGGAR
jgi:hypothetical protein